MHARSWSAATPYRTALIVAASAAAVLLVVAVLWQWSTLYLTAAELSRAAAKGGVPGDSAAALLKDSIEQRNELLRTSFQLAGGLVIAISLYSAWSTYRLTREGQLTDRFSHAIDQLGEDGNSVKQLGGIYALERIARDSPRDHWPVMEILCVFVREYSHRAEYRPIVQSALRSIGRRNRAHETNLGGCLALAGADLSRLDLEGVDLENADLRDARLDGAKLRDARLTGVNLTGASLQEAELPGATLKCARMNGCKLQKALLHQADLRGATLRLAELTEASLASADLSGASLDGANLERAILSDANFQDASVKHTNAAGARFRALILPAGELDLETLRGQRSGGRSRESR